MHLQCSAEAEVLADGAERVRTEVSHLSNNELCRSTVLIDL